MASPVIDSMYYTLIEQIKNEIIDTLRDVFSFHPTWTYIASPSGGPDYDNSRIVITDIYPLECRLLPAITIGFAGGQNKEIAFNQNRWVVKMDADTGLPSYYEFNGAWTSNFIINIAAEDTMTRESLTDYVAHLLMHVKRRYLTNQGVFVRNVSLASESEEPYANDFIYMCSLTLDIYSEWSRKYPLSISGTQTVETIVFKDDTEGVSITGTYPPLSLAIHFGLEGVGPHYEESWEDLHEHGYNEGYDLEYGPGTVYPNSIIPNYSFETGDFTNWTESGWTIQATSLQQTPFEGTYCANTQGVGITLTVGILDSSDNVLKTYTPDVRDNWTKYTIPATDLSPGSIKIRFSVAGNDLTSDAFLYKSDNISFYYHLVPGGGGYGDSISVDYIQTYFS